jgi:hypothetical protein
VLNGIVDEVLLYPYAMTGSDSEVLPDSFHFREAFRAETLDHDEFHATLSGDKLDEQLPATLKPTKVKVG